jgi:hypothetical protein
VLTTEAGTKWMEDHNEEDPQSGLSDMSTKKLMSSKAGNQISILPL